MSGLPCGFYFFTKAYNSKLRPIIDDGEGDVALWNKEIARYFRGSYQSSKLLEHVTHIL